MGFWEGIDDSRFLIGCYGVEKSLVGNKINVDNIRRLDGKTTHLEN